ncbi:MAG: hypothetical protein IT452_19370 [Planctomycetia bacterium]|nr:hypothetical protein [Planctomycetia bacterium]
METKCTSCEEVKEISGDSDGEVRLCDDCISQAMEGVEVLYTCPVCGMQMGIAFPAGYFEDVEEARQLYLAAVESHRSGWCKKS